MSNNGKTEVMGFMIKFHLNIKIKSLKENLGHVEMCDIYYNYLLQLAAV